MEKEISEFLEKILRKYNGPDLMIECDSLISAKPLRTVYLIETKNGNRSELFILHVRQNPFFDNWENEFNALKIAPEKGVLTCELIHHDISPSNPFEAPFLIETYIKGNNFLDRKDWFLQQPGNLFKSMLCLHHIKCERKTSDIPDFTFLPKYRNECLSKLNGSKLIDVPLLEKMFQEVLQWQKEIDFLSHTSLLHGDLHYSNIIISPGNDFYLIDWEMASVGDYCSDLAYFKARTLDYLYPEESSSLFYALIAYYREAFNEKDFDNRMNYYLSYRYLQIIWRCCFPRMSEKWLQFYFDKYCQFRRSISSLEQIE